MEIPPLIPRRISIARAFKFLKNPIPIIFQNIEEYGPTYSFHIGGSELAIITVEPEVIQHVLQKNNKNYYKSQIQSGTVGYFIGNGLLTSNGDYWLQQRRLIQPGFHRKKLAAIFEIINSEIKAFKSSHIPLNEVFNIQDAMEMLTFKIISKSIFSTGISDDELDEFRHKVDLLQEFIIKQIRLPFFRPWFNLIGEKRKHKRLADETKETMDQLIQERKQAKIEYDDLLDMLLSARYQDTNEGMSNKQIIEEALILFVAGHETSSNALAWTFYLLSKHPNVLSQLRSEIDNAIGDRPLQMEDLRKIDYSRMVIEESMRVYPPAWITDRVALEDDEVNGYKIPKGTMVAPFIYGVHHRASIWGKPDEFNPDRFHQNRRKQIGNFEYFPFGGGPRLCIGMGMAMMEMQMVLIEFVRNFDIELINKDEVKLKTLITLQPDENILMRFKERT